MSYPVSVYDCSLIFIFWFLHNKKVFKTAQIKIISPCFYTKILLCLFNGFKITNSPNVTFRTSYGFTYFSITSYHLGYPFRTTIYKLRFSSVRRDTVGVIIKLENKSISRISTIFTSVFMLFHRYPSQYPPLPLSFSLMGRGFRVRGYSL